MARDLEALMQPLAVVDEPGLDALDPRFSAITSLASHGKYAEAADQAEALQADGIYDIRVLSIYLFQAFREGGLAGLCEVLAVVERLVGESFEAIGPLKKREQTVDRRVAWLFGEITDTLEYHALRKGAEWGALTAGASAELLQAIAQGMAAVSDNLQARAFAHGARGMARLTGWLDKQGPALTRAQPAKDEPPAAMADGVAAAPPQDATPTADEAAETLRREVTLTVSFRFLELVSKLRAFEVLVQKHQLRKAAVVADDLQQLLDHFDPKSYFPELFAGFTGLLAEHVGALSEHWDERDSVAWRALCQHYQTDLDRFVKG